MEQLPEVPDEGTAAELAAKSVIAEMIDKFVTEKTGTRIGKTGGKKVFDMVVDAVFKAAVKDGSFRFPAGYGALHVRHLGVGTKPKRLPSGQTTTLGPGRIKLRYVEGVSVKQLLGTDKKSQKERPAA